MRASAEIYTITAPATEIRSRALNIWNITKKGQTFRSDRPIKPLLSRKGLGWLSASAAALPALQGQNPAEQDARPRNSRPQTKKDQTFRSDRPIKPLLSRRGLGWLSASAAALPALQGQNRQQTGMHVPATPDRKQKKVRPFDLTLKRRLPTLPRDNRSTIGVSELNFSVRNGKRWNLTAITT